jgi:hypothetical protein
MAWTISIRAAYLYHFKPPPSPALEDVVGERRFEIVTGARAVISSSKAPNKGAILREVLLRLGVVLGRLRTVTVHMLPD